MMAAALLFARLVLATGERPHLDQDDCARRRIACERACDGQQGMARLNCKTDCRAAEATCRNPGRQK
jgi:hypothetical protein